MPSRSHDHRDRRGQQCWGRPQEFRITGTGVPSSIQNHGDRSAFKIQDHRDRSAFKIPGSRGQEGLIVLQSTFRIPGSATGETFTEGFQCQSVPSSYRECFQDEQ
eukprot:1153332-Pelagomonas_calceolata.AAC.5